MGRFAKDRVNYVRSVVLKQQGSVPNGMEDETEPQPSSSSTTISSQSLAGGGRCVVAERGQLRRRTPPRILTRLRSKLYLQSQRYQIFRSPDFKRRVHYELGIPRSTDVTSSPIGLIRSAIDPSYRSNRLSIGDLWRYQLQDCNSTQQPSADGEVEVEDGESGDDGEDEDDQNETRREEGLQTARDVRRLLIQEAELGYHKDLRKGRYAHGSSKLSQHVVTAQPPPPRRSERLKHRRFQSFARR